MPLQKKDFIEVEFTGRLKEGGIFDSNVKEDLKKINPNIEPKPFVFCLGEGMFLQGIDDFLIGKEVGRYEIELKPENAFGSRFSELVQTVPIKFFIEQKVNPIPGAAFTFDGKLAKILAVSGGRVIVDFNNPLAGKVLIYNINVLRKVDNQEERVKHLINFFFNQDLKFEIKENKVILEVDKKIANFVEVLREKFKDMLGLELETKISEDVKSSQNTEK
ncbi:MAG: peptidylprolyl isomerase [Nanoarchaeota archaeon]